MSAPPPYVLFVAHGRASHRVELDAGSPQWLRALQEAVAECTGVPAAHQKLLFRGRVLAPTATIPPSGSKLMLLGNRQFHASAPALAPAGALRSPSDIPVTASPPAPQAATTTTTSTTTCGHKRLEVDPADLDDEHVLVQATRGKAIYEFLVRVDATVLELKTLMAPALGLPAPQSLRLIIQGRTPADVTALSAFVPATDATDASAAACSPPRRPIKCMVLLAARQHDLHEREDQLRTTQNELTRLRVTVRRLTTAMQRNLAPRDELLVELAAVRDDAARIRQNLAILDDQLGQKDTRLVAGDPSHPTRVALAHAIASSDALVNEVEALNARFGGA